MIYYTLYNKLTDKCLIHPKIGLWYTANLEEARDMLQACGEFVKSFGEGCSEDNFCIINVETREIC